MIFVLSVILSNIIELFLFTYYYWTVLSIKKSSITLKVIIYSILFFLKCIFNLFFVAKINIITSFFIYYILILIFSNSKLIYKILSLGIYFGLSIFSETLTFHISMYFIDWNEHVIMQMIMSKVVLLIFISIVGFFKGINDEENIDVKNTVLLSIQPISIILFIYTTNGEFIIESSNRILTIVSMILLVLSNLISFYIFKEIIRKNSLERELIFEKERANENNTYYKSLTDNIENFKAYKHDLRHHFVILKSMLHLGKKDDADKYIDSLIDELVYISDKRCGDEFWDLVLSSRLHIINKLKINLEFELRKIDLNNISKLDLNIIYGNIIDNAIEACSLCKNRYIKIQSMEINERYQVIKVINSCSYVKSENNQYITTKDNDNIHGYGLSNIKKTVEKYNGEITYLFDDLHSEFKTTIYFDKKTNRK